jgi:hypothetical protein
MTENVESTIEETLRPSSQSVFWFGFRDGIASVVFPASAHKVRFELGSPKLDQRRIKTMRAMMNGRRVELKKKSCDTLIAAIRREAAHISRD